MRITPTKGTKLKISPELITYLSTDRPAVRIINNNDSWICVPPEEKRGMIVFLDHPKETLLNLTEITLTSVKNNVAFAKGI